MGDVPVRIDAASALLVGYVPDDDRIAAVAQTVSGQVEPESDIHASADFRRHLSAVLTRRALRQAAERATS